VSHMRRLLALTALLALAVGLSGCPHKASGSEDEAGGANAAAEVTLTRVQRGDIADTLHLTGTIAAPPNQDVRVSSFVPGRIAEMKVAEGDRVTAGQLLAKIDDHIYRDQLSQAAAAESQAKANLENAKLNLARDEGLFSRGIAARKELEDARTQAAVAQAALQQAEAALSLSRLQLSRTGIVSPLTGMVVKRFVNVGEQVDGTAAQPVAEVASYREVELLASIPVTYLAKVRVGQALTISSDTFPGKTFTGRAVAVSPAVDSTTNAGLVRVRFPNPNGLLRLGMVLTAEALVDKHRGGLTVPPQAIYRDEQGSPHVYRVNGDAAAAIEVQLGIQTPDAVELLSGVQAGDTVILTGGYGLGDKAKIRVKSPEPAAQKKADSKEPSKP
jgi:RND family efflux transporter MFP subunit